MPRRECSATVQLRGTVCAWLNKQLILCSNAYRSLATSRAIEVLTYSSVKESLKQQLGAGKNADG
jgi:hypothetical protein